MSKLMFDRATRTLLGLVLVLGGGLTAVSGCGEDEDATEETGEETAGETTAETPDMPEAPEAPPATPAPTVELDEAQTALAAEIAAAVNNARFARDVTNKDNALIFVYLGATSEDVNVQAAALRAMVATHTYSERFVERYALVTPEYAQVVLMHLGSDNGVVQSAAIEAGKTCIQGDTPNTEVTGRLVDLATNHASPAGRYAAMNTLWHSSGIRTSPEQIAPYVAALGSSEAYVVSGALFRLTSFGRNAPEQPALRATLQGLLTHADPGVRGRAAQVLAAVVGIRDDDRATIAASIMPLLGDSNAFTKSAAANALASLDHRAAIHGIVGLLDDLTSNTYDIRGWTALDGSSGRIHHDGSAWSRVADAALNSLRTFSGRVGERFQYNINHQNIEADLATSAATARTWYASVSAEIPAAE